MATTIIADCYTTEDKFIEIPNVGKIYPNESVIIAFNDVDKYYVRCGKYLSVSNELRTGWYLEPYDIEYMKKAYEKTGNHSFIGNKTFYKKDLNKIKKVIFSEDKIKTFL